MLDQHLETFLVVAECGSFSCAAEKLYVSRTALIQQINLLEARLGFTLLARSNKGVSLTRAGALYYAESKKLRERYESLLNRCMDVERSEGIRIGLLPNFPSIVLPYICGEYIKRFPNRHVDFEERAYAEYFRAFRNGGFDVTAEYVPDYYYNNPSFSVLELMSTVHCVGVPLGHPLSAARRVEMEDLRGQSVMLYAKGVTAADDALRDYLETHVPELRLIDITAYTSTLAMRCQLDKALLVFYDGYETNFPGLVKLPLVIDRDIRIKLGLGYHKNAPQQVQDFLATAAELFAAKAPRE